MKVKCSIIFWVFLVSCLLATASCMKNRSMGKQMGGEMMMPFGSEKDIGYAGDLWKAMVRARLAGPEAVTSVPYEGTSPHGMMLETISGKIKVKGHTGMVHVKSNYGGPDLSREMVANDRARYLKAVTVMFQREPGYDPENQNWFWVKYTADGGLHKNPKGVMLAGRVAKGMETGCIACHVDAEGGDYLFLNDNP